MALGEEELGGTPAALAVIDDYGELGVGASNAHYVLCENGSEYIIKGPSFAPAHPTVAANEWIAARLGSALGLPILDHQIVSMGGKLFFGSSWMQTGSFYPSTDAALFGRCENRERAYGVAVFDCWLINQDRHGANILVRHVTNPHDRHLLLLNDHSHLLVSPLGPHEIGGLMACLDDPPTGFVRLPFIAGSITDADLLRASLDQVEQLAEADIRAAVESTPDELLSASDRGIYADFLVERRVRLRPLMQSNLGVFPNLKGEL